MSVHITKSQWAELVKISENSKSSALDTTTLASSSSSQPPSDDTGGGFGFMSSLVFVLALEGRDTPDPSWSTWQTLLDAVVQTAQPLPSITHVELIVPPSHEKESREGSREDSRESMHFATYINETANWGSSFRNNRSFYLGENAGLWRAVPVACTQAARRVRAECAAHIGTEYSVCRYLCAVPPLRAFASILPDNPLSRAHCGTLAARVLKRSLPEVAPIHPSAWYGPSTLFIETSSGEIRTKTSAFIAETNSMKSIVEQEAEAVALHTLLNGSDDDVQALSNASCCGAIRSLSERACRAELDDTARQIVQKQLATTLLRHSIVNRS